MFIDIHSHAYRKPCPFPNRFCLPDELLAIYQKFGIEKGVLLPLAGPEVYLPQSNDDIIEMARNSGGKFIPFCNIDPRALDNSAHTNFSGLLKYYRDQGVKGFGEFMPNLPFLDPLVQNMFKHVEAAGFPLCFDMSTAVGLRYGLFDEPGLPQLEKSLRRFPKLIFLGHGPPFWAEIAQLEKPADRAGYPAYPVKEEGAVPKLMRRYPNLYGDLSAGSGFNALNRDQAYTPGFLNEFQDRLLFGTDICTPEQDAPLTRLLISLRKEKKIGEDVFQKIARVNAICLLKL
jgi:predicted TIM-barrel fold metal-dependent hydrolase